MDSILSFLYAKPDQVALAVIVSYVIFAIIRGWLIPRKIHLERMAEKDKQIDELVRERDNWREAYQVAERARAELVSQNSDLIDGGQTTNRLLESLRNTYERMNPPAVSPPRSASSREIEG